MIDLLQSDGVIAYYLLNDCAQALQLGDVDAQSADCLRAMEALFSAAVAAGFDPGRAAELKTWLRLQPDTPRALVIAVCIGSAIPDDELARITRAHIEPYFRK